MIITLEFINKVTNISEIKVSSDIQFLMHSKRTCKISYILQWMQLT